MELLFKIGEWVKPLGSDMVKYHIVTTIVETCPGGIQYHYYARGYGEQDTFGRKPKKWVPFRELTKLNQCEVERYVETKEEPK